MPAAAILPVKRFDAAKQRLERLGSGTRSALAAAMFADVLRALERCPTLEHVIVVSGEQHVHELAAEHGLVVVRDHHDKGQSQAARSGLARAAALGCDRAMLVSGDCPLMDSIEVEHLLGESHEEVVIVPDRHGTGTNGLLIDPSGNFEPQFGPGSLARHRAQAQRRGLSIRVREVTSLSLDIDTPDDLEELYRQIDRAHGRAPRTQGVLRQIARSRPNRPVAV